jgi:hypothetical protein
MIRTEERHAVGKLARSAILFAAATALLLIPAVVNQFPFIFIDSSDYIILTPRLYRSSFYQIFVFSSTLRVGLWPAIIAQAAICCLTLWTIFRAFGQNGRLLLYTSALAFFSSLGIFVDFVMPDVFTGVIIIGLFLLIFAKEKISKLEYFLIYIVTLVAVSIHLSNLLIACGCIAVAAIVALWSKDLSRKQVLCFAVAASTCLFAASATFVYNRFVFKANDIAPAGKSFLLANLIEYGPAREELLETCPQAGFQLCQYAVRLPETADEFLWRPGPFQDLGSFNGMKAESNAVVNATIMHRPFAVLQMFALNFFRAFVAVAPANHIRKLSGAGDDTQERIRNLIGQVFGDGDALSFFGSLQAKDKWPIAASNALSYIGLFLSTILVVSSALFLRRKFLFGWKLAVFFLGSYCVNTFVCSALSGVHDRYQARVTWVIVVAALLLFDHLQTFRGLVPRQVAKEA